MFIFLQGSGLDWAGLDTTAEVQLAEHHTMPRSWICVSGNVCSDKVWILKQAVFDKNICQCICQCIKAGKQLGLAFVYNICHSPSRDNHFFISFLLSLPQVNSLSSHSFLVKFQPMSPSSTIILRYFTDKFSEMSADTAVSTLNSTLTLALDALWPLVLFLFVKIYFSVQTLLQ